LDIKTNDKCRRTRNFNVSKKYFIRREKMTNADNNNEKQEWDDSVRCKLRDVILHHLKSLDSSIVTNVANQPWKARLESEIVEAWIVRIMEDRFGGEITGKVDADNRAIIVETVFSEISRTLSYFVAGTPLDKPYSWEEEHMNT